MTAKDHERDHRNIVKILDHQEDPEIVKIIRKTQTPRDCEDHQEDPEIVKILKKTQRS